MATYRVILISARSLSMDSTFNGVCLFQVQSKGGRAGLPHSGVRKHEREVRTLKLALS
jgi:hypothetical protein